MAPWTGIFAALTPKSKGRIQNTGTFRAGPISAAPFHTGGNPATGAPAPAMWLHSFNPHMPNVNTSIAHGDSHAPANSFIMGIMK